MANLIQEQSISSLTVTEKYDTGWINRSDWTNVHLGSDTTKDTDSNVTHNLNTPLSDLLIKVLVSTDGTDANSFEVGNENRFGSSSYPSSFNHNFTIYAVDNNNVKIQTGEEGLLYYDDDGVATGIAAADIYYKIIVLKPLTNPITISTNATAPIGSVQMFAGSTAPSGWFMADGTAVSRTTYASLFAVIGTSYGTGDGSTTFNLPDFQGRSPKGVGTSSGGTDVTHVAETVALGTKYNDKTQGHWHDLTTDNNTRTIGRGVVAGSGTHVFQAEGQGTRYSTAFATDQIEDTDNSYGTPRVGTTTTSKALGVNFIIKY
jgi:microcystin-dependent protein